MKYIVFIIVIIIPLIVLGATSENYRLDQERTGFIEFDGDSTSYEFKTIIGDAASEVSTSTNYTIDQRRIWIAISEDEDEDGGGGGGGGGDQTILSTGVECPEKGDLNDDCRVNLIDFSIAGFWYKKSLSESLLIQEKTRLSGDGIINLVDLSIMGFYWTG